ncbi:hypothetical protein MMC07_009483 [Pseudocyphellaria aurata]|nr:hypothetical protein [Pseudocyphellaria aurata]
MSVTPTKPAGDGRTVNTTSPSMPNPATVNDDIIPVLIAANPGLILNYKQMTALDPHHRTNSSWEHKFRKWRARAKEIADGTAEVKGESSKDAGGTAAIRTSPDDGEAAPIKKKRATKTKPKLGTDMVAEKQATPNATTEDGANDNQDLPLRPTTARKGPAKDPSLGEGSSANNGDDVNIDAEDTTAKANTGKKRDETTQDDINESPRKKARAEKKGTARVVKKKAIKPTEEVVSEEDSDSEKTVKAKGKGRKGAGAAKSATKGKAKMDEASGQDEGQKTVVV